MELPFGPRIVLISLLFGVLNALVIAGTAEIAIEVWGRPGGVGYGILIHYYWIGLSIHGVAMALVFQCVATRIALLVCLTTLTLPSVLLLPASGERPFIAIYLCAILMCLLLAGWQSYCGNWRTRR